MFHLKLRFAVCTPWTRYLNGYALIDICRDMVNYTVLAVFMFAIGQLKTICKFVCFTADVTFLVVGISLIFSKKISVYRQILRGLNLLRIFLI
jgi:hypothetical protein